MELSLLATPVFVRKIAGMSKWLYARNRRGQAADTARELALYTSGLVKQWATRKMLFPLKSKAINYLWTVDIFIIIAFIIYYLCF